MVKEARSMSQHANTRFGVSLPPSTDPRFEETYQQIHAALVRAAIDLRTKYAQTHGVSFWNTDIRITTDPERSHIIHLEAYYKGLP
jgi:hypothetical protein